MESEVDDLVRQRDRPSSRSHLVEGLAAARGVGRQWGAEQCPGRGRRCGTVGEERRQEKPVGRSIVRPAAGRPDRRERRREPVEVELRCLPGATGRIPCRDGLRRRGLHRRGCVGHGRLGLPEIFRTRLLGFFRLLLVIPGEMRGPRWESCTPDPSGACVDYRTIRSTGQ